MSMKRIMVATDGSQGADRAVAAATELAAQCAATLSIVTVGGNYSSDDIRELARAEGDLGSALDLASQEFLDSARERAERAGVANVETQAAWGDAATAILEVAARTNADAIVLGRRGRGQLAGLLLGSVSLKVVTLAPCMVIVVP